MNMRPLLRSLLLVFVLWFALFPTLCYASETVTDYTYGVFSDEVPENVWLQSYTPSKYTVSEDDVANGLVHVWFSLASNTPWSQLWESGDTSFVSPLSFSYEIKEPKYPSDRNFLTYSDRESFTLYANLANSDGSALFDADSQYDFTLANIFHQIRLNYRVISGSNISYPNAYFPITYEDITAVTLEYAGYNGELEIKEIDLSNLSSNGSSFGISLKDEVSPSFDVERLVVTFSFNASGYGYAFPSNSDMCNGQYYQTGFSEGVLKIKPVDESVGLLKGIIEWLKSIRDGIVNVFNAITELPQRIWNLIETGLKNLFVPSETAIADMKDKWDALLADRFGVVYESGALVIDIANSVSEASTSETITFPSVSYNFSGTDFTFGGYEVDVIPNGFEFLADILKGVLDIVCTLAFINAMRRKYDELMMR